jgi:hypothetical protein
VAGYSGTPLHKKLGIKDGSRLAVLGAPDGFDDTLGELPPRVERRTQPRGSFDVVVFFTTERSQLERRLDALTRAIHPAGGLWVAWPKRASGLPTDLDENAIREVALPKGLVDNKVCAIDETWSGLRLVIRKENR